LAAVSGTFGYLRHPVVQPIIKKKELRLKQLERLLALVVPVHIPVWNDDWDRVRCQAYDHVSEVKKGEQMLLNLLPCLRSRLGLREVLWIERALAILGSTVEILRLSGASQDFCAA